MMITVLSKDKNLLRLIFIDIKSFFIILSQS